MRISILNHVLGPIMRGPSSSHSAAALRIGRLARDLMGGQFSRVIVTYDPNGSLVNMHRSQGSDLGLAGGLLGWEADDPRLLEYESHLQRAGIEVRVCYESFGADHPNTYHLRLTNPTTEHTLLAVSLGGGMIEVRQIDDQQITLTGGSYVLYDSADRKLLAQSTKPFEPQQIKAFAHARLLKPVLPVLDSDGSPDFVNGSQMAEIGRRRGLNLPQLALRHESARSGLADVQIREQVGRVLAVMRSAYEDGLRGTSYADRILPSQVGGLQAARQQDRMVGGEPMHDVIEAITAVLETKSSMGPIVAAPTAGSCGVLPGTLLGLSRRIAWTDEQLIDALLCAGIIGVFIAEGATFAAEEGGCMAECGSASGMVAAALVYLLGGTLSESIAAASLALQNSLGMICDPVGNRVEAPCLGKNTMAGLNAMAAANMALAGYQHLVPLDEVVAAMNQVGKALPRELRCTGLGGLSVTPTSRRIDLRVNGVTQRLENADLDRMNVTTGR
ncbi:MAG: serine dehydratase [Phycisphaera sp.]|nr:serine dehydratase [Phycisphaera sp.]